MVKTRSRKGLLVMGVLACTMLAISSMVSARQAAGPPPAISQEVIQAAAAFAKTAAGSDDSPEYFRIIESTLAGVRAAKSARRSAGMHSSEPPLHSATKANAPFVRARVAVQESAAQRTSIRESTTWQVNNRKLFQEMIHGLGPTPRIFGGRPSLAGEFPHCVTVGQSSGFCCTGTLVAPRVVVTAAHCIPAGCSKRVYFGLDANSPDAAKIVSVKKAVQHPNYNAFTNENDIAVLILEKDAPGVTPCPVAASADIDATHFVRLAGYGFTESGLFGVQYTVDVPTATTDCSVVPDQTNFGCKAGREIVAGGNGHDSCNGDSGGPAYLVKDNKLYLAGATSRATANSVNGCGDGGVYVRVDKYLDWVKSIAVAESVVAP